MADAVVSRAPDDGCSLPGFQGSLYPGLADRCWYRGRDDATGQPMLVRRVEGVAYAAAVRDLAGVLGMLDASPVGVAPPIAIVVVHGRKIVAGSAAVASGLRIDVDVEAAARISADAPVDVWACYADAGDEALANCAAHPRATCEQLAMIAAVLDGLSEWHGAIDAPALRITESGPLVFAVGLAPLEATRRERLDACGPWVTVSPERCLPPGIPTSAGDQYALAVLWAIARTGRPPHEAATADSLVRAKLSQPPSLEGIPPAERDVLERALNASAENRFPSCSAFLRSLTEVVQDPAMADVAAPRKTEPIKAAIGPPPAKPAETVEPAHREKRSEAALSRSKDTVAETRDAITKPVQSRQTAPPVAAEPERTRPEPPPVMPAPVETAAPAVREPPIVLPAEPAAPLPVAADKSVAVRLASAPYKAGDLILPGYRLDRLLGKGGFGEVWKAAAPGGMSVAIKVIGNLGRKEGAREFRALGTVKGVHHAHIVPIFGIWLKTAAGRVLDDDESLDAGRRILSTQGQNHRETLDVAERAPLESLELVIAMGLGECTLFDRLKRNGDDESAVIPVADLLRWMRQAALAIDHFNRGTGRGDAPASAVQHCDIKPHNMLLVGNVVQVCDFGLARVQGQVRLTANNLVSIAYAAPEMMVSPYDPSSSTDQYSLAVTYYELRTGRLPYGDQDAASTRELSAVELLRLKTDGNINVSLVSPAEQRVLGRALSLVPSERFGSCEEFVDMLETAVEAAESPPPPPPPPFPWGRAIGLGFGAIAAAGMIGWLLSRPSASPPPRFLHDAEMALQKSVTEDAIDQANVRRASELATKALGAGENADACKVVIDAAAAIEQADMLIASISDDGTVIQGLSGARDAVDRLPATVPDAVRGALARSLEKRWDSLRSALAEQVRTNLDAAVGEDGIGVASHLDKASAAAARLAGLDDPEGKRLAAVVGGIREIFAVSQSGEPEPAGLDEAIARLDRASDTLSPQVTTRLGRALADRVVNRAVRRLRDDGLRSPDSSTTGKRRAIEDSCQDLAVAIRLDPHSWRAHGELGFCESLGGRYAEAVDRYREALRLLDESGGTQDSRGQLLRRRAFALVEAGRYVDAADDYLAVMGGDPQVFVRLWNLKSKAWDAGDHEAAAAVLERMEKLLAQRPEGFGEAPAPLEVLGDYAWLLACGKGDHSVERAVPIAKQSLSLVEDLLSRAIEERGRMELSLRRANALDTLAVAYARAGRFEDALRTIDEAITAVGDSELRGDFQAHRATFEEGRTWDTPVEPAP